MAAALFSVWFLLNVFIILLLICLAAVLIYQHGVPASVTRVYLKYSLEHFRNCSRGGVWHASDCTSRDCRAMRGAGAGGVWQGGGGQE